MKYFYAKLSALVLLLSALTFANTSYAALKRDGDWPAEDAKVTLDFSGARGEALRLVADKAGISYVAADLPSGNVALHLKDLPAGKAFELIFEDDRGTYVATREGNVVRFRASAAETLPAVPAVPAVPAMPAAPALPALPNDSPALPEEGGDRVIKGQSLRIEKGEVVHDVSVFGGSVEVYGKVTGNLVVTGGSAHVHDGAWIKGDATAIGGSLHVLRGARIDGNAGVVGGLLRKEDGAIVKGTITGKGKSKPESEAPKSSIHGGLDAISNAVSSFAMLFVFGSMLIALAGERMRKLRVEAATSPMRNFALGILGFFGFIAAVVVLCITVVGIPVALFGVLFGFIAMYAGIVATVSLGGELLLRKRTENPYAHLALGALLFVLVTALPFVGSFVSLAVGAVGIGVLISTRLAGLVGKKKDQPTLDAGPYRTNV